MLVPRGRGAGDDVPGAAWCPELARVPEAGFCASAEAPIGGADLPDEVVLVEEPVDPTPTDVNRAGGGSETIRPGGSADPAQPSEHETMAASSNRFVDFTE